MKSGVNVHCHIVLGLSLLLFPIHSEAQLAAVVIDVGENPIGPSVNTQTIGWDFTVTQAITVTDLGIWDADLDGLADAHSVGIWDAGGNLITQALLSSGTSANLNGQFRYTPVQPVQLSPGNYAIGAHYQAFSLDFIPSEADDVLTQQEIIFTGPRFGLGPGLVFPNVEQAGLNHFGPNFLFEPVESCECDALLVGDFGPPVGKKKQLGSTIPIKFNLSFGGVQIQGEEELAGILEAMGCPVGCPEIQVFNVTDLAEGIELTDDEIQDNVGDPDLGYCFRYSEGNWVYNLRVTSAFQSQGTFVVRVVIGDCIFTPGNALFQTK